MTCRILAIVVVFGLVITGCYSFKGISIPPTISTFYVDQFQIRAGNAPPDIGQRFSDELRDVVIQNSRLNYEESIPDIEFSGTVTTFSVTSVAPESSGQGENVTFGSSLNRLSIGVEVEYVNSQDEEDTWRQTFSFFQDFDNTVNLDDVQEDFIEAIFDQIITDVFNRAFTNW